MNIRQATINDLPEVAGLWSAMAYEAVADCKLNVAWWIERAKKSFDTGIYSMLVAEEAGCIVGFIDWYLLAEPLDSEIHAIYQYFYVYPEYRSTNASSRLYKEAINQAKASGATVREHLCMSSTQEMWLKKGYKHKMSYISQRM